MIYLDNAATTKPDPLFIEAVNETMRKMWGNPSSSHAWGEKAAARLQKAREMAARAIGAKPEQIIFTSSGTEANQLALNFGCNIFASKIEHPSILANPYEDVLVDEEGLIWEDILESQLEYAKNHCLPNIFCVQMVNSETGVWQDVERLTRIIHDSNGLVHCDAVQAFPHFRIDVNELNVDTLSISGHKFGCAPGVGLLYAKDPDQIYPLIVNSQEFGLRGGTENLPYIYGMACMMQKVTEQDYDALEQRYIDFDECLLNTFTHERLDFRFNGVQVTYAIRSVGFNGVDGMQLAEALSEHGIMVSTGSACSSGEHQISPVLEAMHVPEEYAKGTIRISFCPETTMEEVQLAANAIAANVRLLGGKLR